MRGIPSFFAVVEQFAKGVYELTPRAREQSYYREIFANCGLKIGRGDDPMLPVILNRQQREYGYDLIIHVPPGLSMRSFLKKKIELEHAFDAEIEVEAIGAQNVLVRVMPHPIPVRKEYEKPELPEGMALPLVIGYSRAGLLFGDLAEFPHLCVAGETFGGKSTFLRQALVTLKLDRPDVQLFLIDMKRLEFSYWAPYAWYAYTMREAIKMLEYLEKELHRRLELLDKAGCVNIQEYHSGDVNKMIELPYLVLVIDEFSQVCPELAKDDEDKKTRQYAHSILVDLVCLARAVGIHVIICTQRPDHKVLPGQLKANIPAALCFRVKNSVNSEIVLDNNRAAYLPRIRGRAIYQFDREVEVQVMWLSNDKAREMLKALPTQEKVVNLEDYRKKVEMLPY